MKNRKRIIRTNNNAHIKRERTSKYFSNISNNKKDLDEKIREILDDEMNKECFDCGSLNPQFISINNGIFLCHDCIKVHNKFNQNISLIINNNLCLLTNKEILFIYYGGNTRLNNFVNYEYPGLQNYQPNILYNTQAMNYYRNRLIALVEKKNMPEKPNSIYAYKLLGENVNKYSKNRLFLEVKNNKIYNNEINIAQRYSNKFRKIENGKNLKYIDKDLKTKNGKNKKYTYLNLDPFSSNNSFKNIFNLDVNKKENQNNKNLRIKYIEDNDLNKNKSLYNKTFFKEMKNIFRYENLKGKLRMRLNEKENAKDYIKDELLTHQASLSNTIYFPNNNLGICKKDDKYLKKMNIPKNFSIKNLEKCKNINNNISHIYIKPRMSNNSFSKNYKIIKNQEYNNLNFNKKRNSIINGMSKFSLKKLNLRDDLSLKRKENDIMSKRQYLYSKSNTTMNIFPPLEQKKFQKDKRNILDVKNNNCIISPNVKYLSKRELSFNNLDRNNNMLSLNETVQSNKNNKDKIINHLRISPVKKRKFNKYNLNINGSIEENKNTNKNYKKDNKKINFIKVIKTTMGRRNNSDLNFKKIEYFNKSSNINNDINNKIKIFNDNGSKNNVFLNDEIEDNKNNIYLKALQDKQEQVLIENSDQNKLLLDQNCLFNKTIDINVINKKDNDFFKNNKQNSFKVEKIINGGLKENNIKFNNSFNSLNNYKKFKTGKDEKFFFNKTNCTDLINLSKENNSKKLLKNGGDISDEFLLEAKNLINILKMNKIQNNVELDKLKILNKIKKDKEIKEGNKSNSKNSIRNKYKQKAELINEKKSPINDSNEKQYLNIKNINNFNITEDNWNINQLGEVEIYEKIKYIELD